MEWIQTNWTNILTVLGAVYALASAVAAITPSDRDDTFLAKVGTIADRIGLNLKGK